MLIGAASALLVVGLGVVFITSRKTRWFWPVVALFVGSATLFAVHARATNREAKRLNESLVDSCSYLTAELNTVVFDYQTVLIAEEERTDAPVNVVRVRDQYAKLISSHRYWLQACIPDAARCLPSALNERTFDKIEAVLWKHERCR